MERLTENEFILKYTGKNFNNNIERLITANEIIGLQMNEITLVNAVREGKIIPYKKSTLEKIDIKSIGKFYTKLSESFKKHIDDEKYEKGYYFADFEDKFRFHIGYEIINEQTLEEFYEFISENMKNWGEDYEIIESFHNESTEISQKRYSEIINGWGNKQVKEIVFDENTVFKEREIRFEAITKEQIKEIDNRLSNYKTECNREKTALKELEILSLEKLWPEATRQQKEGFEVFKKRLKKYFQIGIRAAVAVIDYCHKTNTKLRFEDLENLFDEKVPLPDDAKSLEEYRGKISTELAHDIYKELGERYRHKRGEKKLADQG